ncbi:MAG: leucine-rich repeat domain-containing protein, partial [Candidatus Methanoplasma sp.]|nr:leucine-rich repeat domain-containing protein [Candidatus Methanoplasma sp.]
MKARSYAAVIAVAAMAAAGAFVLSNGGSGYSDAADVDDTIAANGIVWSLHGGVLTVSKGSGTGVIDDYDYVTTSNTSPWLEYKGDITRIVIGDGVTEIGAYAFCRLVYATSVSIPGSVETIGAYAFYYNMFESVSIPGSVETIGAYAFYWAVSLTTLSIPEGVESIGQRAFAYNNLEEVFIPASVESIGEGAFAGCMSLRNVAVADGSRLTTVSDRALDLDDSTSVRGLKVRVWTSSDAVYDLFNTEYVSGRYDSVNSSTTISNGVVTHTTVSRGASAAAYTDPGAGLPSSLNGTEVSGALWRYDAETRTLTFSGSGVITHAAGPTATTSSWEDIRPFVKKIVLVGGDLTIGDWAFRNCASLESVDLSGVKPNTAIGTQAFRNCYVLGQLAIPEGTTRIEDRALSNMHQLESLVIPASVTYIGGLALENDRKLASLTILAPRLDNLSSDSTSFIKNNYSLAAVSVYDGGEGVTPTRLSLSGSANVGMVVVYFNEHVGGPVYATQSSTGVVTLSGFPEKGAVKVGTSFSSHIKTVLDGGSFNVSILGSGRTAYAYLPAPSAGYIGYFVVGASIANGTITPSGDVSVVGGAVRVADGGVAKFTFSANPGYAVKSVSIDGSKTSTAALAALAAGAHTFTHALGDALEGHSISVETTRLQFSVTASADSNSTITPAGSVAVDNGGSVSFTFSANSGYAISDVLVDGASVPSAASAGKYAFSGVTSNHTISVKSAPSASSPAGSGNSDGSGSGS